MINRNYMCLACGTIRRHSAHYLTDGEPRVCCEKSMHLLSYEQTVAATHLDVRQRLDWMANGGHVAKRSGKRKWKAVNQKPE